jgi:hypothetical protein
MAAIVCLALWLPSLYNHRTSGGVLAEAYMTTLCVNLQRYLASPAYNLEALSLGSSMGCLWTRPQNHGFGDSVGRSSFL